MLAVYPNPASNLMTIALSVSKARIELYDLVGNQVASVEGSFGKNTVDVSGLSNGTYFVKVNVDGAVTTRKVTINR